MLKRPLAHILLIFFFSWLFSGCAFSQKTTGKGKEEKKVVQADVPKDSTVADSSQKRRSNSQRKIEADSLIAFAEKFLGTGYRSGGTTKQGFDCSGFTSFVFAKFGYKLPHTSAGQGLLGVEVKKHKAKKGDLIFFKGGNRNSKRIGHVGLVISEKDGEVTFIHSAVSGGIRIDSSEAPYYKARFVSVRRILN